jgi:hypothetical protein
LNGEFFIVFRPRVLGNFSLASLVIHSWMVNTVMEEWERKRSRLTISGAAVK